MGNFKELWNGEHKSFFRYAAVVTVFFVVWVGFCRHDNLVRWARAGMELRQQNRQIEKYRKEIESMDARINRLSTDRDTLEQYARENFHFAAPGDDVYIDEN